MGVVEREYGNHAMPGWRKGTVGYHIDDGRIFDENNPEKGVECEGKCLIHYSMKSDAVKVYHVEVHLGETCILFQCADRIVMKTPSIDAISLLIFFFLMCLCIPSYFSW